MLILQTQTVSLLNPKKLSTTKIFLTVLYLNSTLSYSQRFEQAAVKKNRYENMSLPAVSFVCESLGRGEGARWERAKKGDTV